MKKDYKEKETGLKSIKKRISYLKRDLDDAVTQKQDYYSNLMDQPKDSEKSRT